MSKSRNKKLYQQNLKLREQVKMLTSQLQELQPKEIECKYNSFEEWVDSEEYNQLYEAYKQSEF